MDATKDVTVEVITEVKTYPPKKGRIIGWEQLMKALIHYDAKIGSDGKFVLNESVPPFLDAGDEYMVYETTTFLDRYDREINLLEVLIESNVGIDVTIF
jgi:hypothetical protein